MQLQVWHSALAKRKMPARNHMSVLCRLHNSHLSLVERQRPICVIVHAIVRGVGTRIQQVHLCTGNSTKLEQDVITFCRSQEQLGLLYCSGKESGLVADYPERQTLVLGYCWVVGIRDGGAAPEGMSSCQFCCLIIKQEWQSPFLTLCKCVVWPSRRTYCICQRCPVNRASAMTGHCAIGGSATGGFDNPASCNVCQILRIARI